MRLAIEALPSQNHGYLDFESIAHVEAQCETIRKLVHAIEEIIAHFPWRIRSLGLQELKAAKRRVQITQNDYGHFRNNLIGGV